MAVIRVYRKFYRIGSSFAGNSYTLIDPISISANVYLKDTSTLVESPSTITKESEGVYYVDLTPILYSYDNVYDLKWTIQYITGAPLKILVTTFKLNPVNISGEIYTEFENQIIDTEVNDQIIEIIIL